jgi:hypothetical protein
LRCLLNRFGGLLMIRVLRSKYYLNGDILKVGPKSGSSFTWQSIIARLTTFKRGYIWRVGNEDNINIYTLILGFHPAKIGKSLHLEGMCCIPRCLS